MARDLEKRKGGKGKAKVTNRTEMQLHAPTTLPLFKDNKL